MNDSMSVVLYRIDPPKPAAQRTPFGDQTWPRSCPTARAPPSFVRMQCAEVGPRELSEAEKLPSTWCKARFDFSCGQKNRQNDTTPADGNYITRPIVEPQIAFHNLSIQFIFSVLTGLTLRTFPEYSPFAFVYCFNYDHFQRSNRLAAILPNKPRQRPTSQMFSTWGRTKSTSPPGGT